MNSTLQRVSSWLVPLAGPPMAPLELPASDGALIIGRSDQCQLLLPPDADKVSRMHARFSVVAGQWAISDLKSRWGTFVNGRRLQPEEQVILVEGDLIRVTPWTFAFSITSDIQGLESVNDAGVPNTRVRTFTPEHARPLADEMLTLLLESATSIHAAEDEPTLWKLIMDSACRGTGLTNASVLRPLDARGRIEVVASRLTPGLEEGRTYSRSLIAAASTGVVAEFSSSATGGATASESIAEMHVSTALCVPLMLGTTVAAYLYLDARMNPRIPIATPIRPNSTAYCVALGRMASLAMANLKRVDMERRQASMEAELSAGAEAQRWIFPQRQGRYGSFAYIGESRAGRYVGGDFFDILRLDDNRVIVALGDVAGKGIPASVLMTASQGFLHAALQDSQNLARAVTALNEFVCPRCPDNRFLTLWVGLLDASAGTLTYIDAGHGYALLSQDGGPFQKLGGEDDGNVPIGLAADVRYVASTVAINAMSRLLVVSDGIIEQPNGGSGARTQFDVSGVISALAGSPAEDEIAVLFDAVIKHAAGPALADDATAVLVRFHSKSP